MRRRRFLEMGLAGVLGASAAHRVAGGSPGLGNPAPPSPLPRRPLGRTGERLSLIGLGGMTLADETREEAGSLVREAFENGVNYFDVAPSYGNAEDRLGPALQPYREKIFLACKTLARDRKGAEAELDRSLRKLRTDRFDLYQFHALSKAEDVERIFGPDGAAETFVKARKAGKIRFIGFSAHSAEAALLAMDRIAFDTILFPVNYLCFFNGRFGPRVIEKAGRQKLGILAIKALARTPWAEGEARSGCPKCWYKPILDPEEQRLALRFTLSQPVTAAIPPGDKNIFRAALRLAREFSPLSELEQDALRGRGAGLQPIFGARGGKGKP